MIGITDLKSGDVITTEVLNNDVFITLDNVRIMIGIIDDNEKSWFNSIPLKNGKQDVVFIKTRNNDVPCNAGHNPYENIFSVKRLIDREAEWSALSVSQQLAYVAELENKLEKLTRSNHEFNQD